MDWWQTNKNRCHHACMLSCSSCTQLCNPMDCSLPGFSVHGILQARVLDWIAISSSRRSLWPRDWTCISCISCIGRRVSWLLAPLGKPGVTMIQFSSVAQSCGTLRPHGLQHTRPPCPSPKPGAYSNSCPLSCRCHPTISSSFFFPISSCLQSFRASESFQMSQFFPSGGQSIGVSASASVFPMNIQDWFPLGCTGWISLLSNRLLRVFSNTTVQKHQFFGTWPSL